MCGIICGIGKESGGFLKKMVGHELEKNGKGHSYLPIHSDIPTSKKMTGFAVFFSLPPTQKNLYINK